MKLSKIVTAPIDVIRHNVAQTRANQAAYEAILRERAAADRAARDALVAVWCTTTGTAPYDYETVGMVFGRPAVAPEDAIYELKLAARSAGGDGVLGAAILPSTIGRIDGNAGGVVKTQYIGYGTAIRRLGLAD